VKLGIDASNLLLGGGVTHLEELLGAADPKHHGFSEVIVWGRSTTIDRLPKRPWLRCVKAAELDGNLLGRALWRTRHLDRFLHEAGCDVLFVPGGSYLGGFRPFVTMSRSLLPFDDEAIRGYGVSWMRLKMMLLRLVQTATFRSAAGVIFLTTTAREWVTRMIGSLDGRTEVIPHGVSSRFLRTPAAQRSIDDYSVSQPFRLLYVSNLEPYKHHPEVVSAVRRLRKEGYPIALDLVGGGSDAAQREIAGLVAECESAETITYHRAVAYSELPDFYHRADAFVFASSCENLPNILLEAMAAGLPIASSSCSVMPEVLGDAGVYFDPRSPDSISQALRKLLDDPGLRARLAGSAQLRVGDWTWSRCADKTFAFLDSAGAIERRRDDSV
jgi:glycosyltransferase involved in cell wall biosynthesis